VLALSTDSQKKPESGLPISIPKLVLVDVLRVLWTGRATTQGNSDPLPMPHFVLVDAVKMLECQGNS